MVTNRDAGVWELNSIQFPRLLAEIKAAGLTPEQVKDICTSMDLPRENLTELFDRAEEEREAIKSVLHCYR